MVKIPQVKPSRSISLPETCIPRRIAMSKASGSLPIFDECPLNTCSIFLGPATDLPDASNNNDQRAYWMTQVGVLQGEAARFQVRWGIDVCGRQWFLSKRRPRRAADHPTLLFCGKPRLSGMILDLAEVPRY